MQRRSIPRSDARYKQLRFRNNNSVQKSREKARRERDETIHSINELEKDNHQLIENVQTLKQEYDELQNLFKQHTGIDIDKMLTSQTKSPSKSSKEETSSSKPLLTINTTEDKSSSSTELDANNLDGSVVLINGVQYKIVSMNNT